MATGSEVMLRSLESEEARLNEALDRIDSCIASLDERRDEDSIENYEVEKQILLRKRIEANLADIHKAISKLEKGNYGLCENCGRRIESARLEVMPQATLCLSCRMSQDKKRQYSNLRKGVQCICAAKV